MQRITTFECILGVLAGEKCVLGQKKEEEKSVFDQKVLPLTKGATGSRRRNGYAKCRGYQKEMNPVPLYDFSWTKMIHRFGAGV